MSKYNGILILGIMPILYSCDFIKSAEKIYNLTPVQVSVLPVNSDSSLFISWSQTDVDNFKSYEIYYDENKEVGLSSFLGATVRDQKTTDIEIKDLKKHNKYYVKVFVVSTHGKIGSEVDSGQTTLSDFSPLKKDLFWEYSGDYSENRYESSIGELSYNKGHKFSLTVTVNDQKFFGDTLVSFLSLKKNVFENYLVYPIGTDTAWQEEEEIEHNIQITQYKDSILSVPETFREMHNLFQIMFSPRYYEDSLIVDSDPSNEYEDIVYINEVHPSINGIKVKNVGLVENREFLYDGYAWIGINVRLDKFNGNSIFE